MNMERNKNGSFKKGVSQKSIRPLNYGAAMCIVCEKELKKTSPHKKCCSDECALNRNREMAAKRREKNREEYRRDSKKWRDKNPERVNKYRHTRYNKAHIILNNAIARGEIKKRNKCLTCGEALTECHHPDYSKPLEFIELCRLCHKQLHRNKKQDESKQIRNIGINLQ